MKTNFQVGVLTHMVKICKSMRCYFKGTSNSPLAQFSFSSEDGSDSGDCGGIPVFTFCSIASFGMCALVTSVLSACSINFSSLLLNFCSMSPLKRLKNVDNYPEDYISDKVI